ncbi:MAG: hypothetical protein AABW90_03100 [Nanoarchaeota archaeon]
MKSKMRKTVLSFLLMFFVIVFALNTVIAQFVDVTEVEINGLTASPNDTSQTISVTASETIPVLVKFKALKNASDVKVKVYIEGFKNEVSDETSRFHVIKDNTYIKRFSLTVPSTLDFDELTEELRLLVRVSARGQDSDEVFVPLEIQRELHSLNLLSVDLTNVVVLGDKVTVDVVIENNGNERLNNVYVKASIPSLGISRIVYAGDLASEQDVSDDDINDAVNKVVYLTIPKNTVPGNYELEVEAYNYDASSKATTRVVIEDVKTGVLSSTSSRTIAPGQETTFDLVLVNPSNQIVVYTIIPEESKGVLVDVTEPVVVVSTESSKTVKVRVKATENAEEGTYIVTVNANTETGMSKQVKFSVNVQKLSKITGAVTDTTTNTTVILTVVLVVIFVVLLIILIVLLSRKPETEEAETSYY